MIMSFSTPVAIVLGGLIAGTLDIGTAALINGRSPLVILLVIASGLLGKASFQGGMPALAAVNNSDVQGCVRNIESLVRHYSSRTEDFLEYVSRGPDFLDFLALEETDLICLNRGAQQGDETCSSMV